MQGTASPIPLERLPGFTRWGKAWRSLCEASEPVWIFGAAGTGVSTVAATLAKVRGAAYLDDADLLDAGQCSEWLREHPEGVFGAHQACGEPELQVRCLPLELPSLEAHPESVAFLVEAFASREGLALPLPEPLYRLPCPGNLRGLHNRVLRYKLLGQMGDPPTSLDRVQSLPLEEDAIALNLHVLERLLLHRALRRSYGNRQEAARRLGVSRRQLYLLIARHGDPLRAEPAVAEGPKRLVKVRTRQNSSEG